MRSLLWLSGKQRTRWSLCYRGKGNVGKSSEKIGKEIAVSALKRKYYEIYAADNERVDEIPLSYADFCTIEYPDGFSMIVYLKPEDIPEYCEENGFDLDTFLEVTDSKHMYFYQGWPFHAE